MLRKSFKRKFYKQKFLLFLVAGLLWLSFQASAFSASVICTVSINPLSVSLSAPKIVFEGDHFKVKAEVKNLGEGTISEVKATLYLPLGLSPQGHQGESELTKNLGALPAEGKKTASWRVRASSAGQYVLLVSVSGKDKEKEALLTAEDSTVIEVVKEPAFPAIWNLLPFSISELSDYAFHSARNVSIPYR